MTLFLYIIIRLSRKSAPYPVTVRKTCARCENTDGGKRNEKNISAQEASENDGTRLQKKNEDCQRQKGPRKKTRKGQKKADILIKVWENTPNGSTASKKTANSVFFSRRAKHLSVRVSYAITGRTTAGATDAA